MKSLSWVDMEFQKAFESIHMYKHKICCSQEKIAGNNGELVVKLKTTIALMCVLLKKTGI